MTFQWPKNAARSTMHWSLQWLGITMNFCGSGNGDYFQLYYESGASMDFRTVG